MYLAKLKISNFRGIKSADIKISPHFILLGSNNSGKSTIIDAVGLLLGKEQLVRNIGDYDFFGGNPQPDDRIIIRGVISGFEFKESIKHGEWFNDNNAGVPQWYNPNTGELKNERDEKSKDKLAVEIGFAARFDKDELNYETIRYFVTSHSDPFEETNQILINRNLTKKIGFFLLPSKRNWERIISFGSEIFRKVIEFQNAIPAESICQIRDDLKNNEHGIEKEPPFKDIVRRINDEIKGFSGKKSHLNFLPTDTDIESVRKSITPYLIGKGNTNLPLGCHGTGIISLQTLLLLLEFGRFRQLTDQNFILAAEEPELHLHPGMHRRLVGRMRSLSTQTIITTHSPEIASYYKPQEINIIQTDEEGEAVVRPLLDHVIPPENALMKLFTVYRKETSEALMHSKTLIPEGITEYYWFNKLINVCITTEGWLVDENSISSFGIIPTQESHVVPTYQTFVNLQENLYPFIDGDSAGNNYVSKLKKESLPPKIILQLPNNRCLEHLIAWIILPKDSNEITELKKILIDETINYTNLDELADFLKEKHKSYWKLHDELIDLISINSNYNNKAKLFIKAFDIIQSNTTEAKYNKFWKKDETKSDSKTNVLILNLFS